MQHQTAIRRPVFGGMVVPPGGTDAHVHVFDPMRFPYAAARSYTPGPASTVELGAHLRQVGLERVVLVQPSPYGADNDCLLDALAELGPRMARGVAVIEPGRVRDGELTRLAAAGVVAVRVNLASQGEAGRDSLAEVRDCLERVAPHGLAVQIFAALPRIATLANILAEAPVPVILDHFAGARAEAGIGQPGFAELLDLLRTGRVWVKLSGYGRASGRAGHTDLAPLARAMIAANSSQLIWASDWPHTGLGAERATRPVTEIEPFRDTPTAPLLRGLAEWVDGPATWDAILSHNPARLFRFTDTPAP